MEPQQRIVELERQVAQLLQEKEDLQRDVENLCLSAGSNMFSSSYVLSERIYSAEKELSLVKSQLTKVMQERDNFKEDIVQFKNSKKAVDNSWKDEMKKNQQLEKELMFYQSQSTKLLAERDQAEAEAEELRTQNLELETSLKRIVDDGEVDRMKLKDSERKLELSLEQNAKLQKQLEAKTKECYELADAKKRLKQSQDSLQRSEESRNALQQQLSGANKQLETKTKEAEDLKLLLERFADYDKKTAELIQLSAALQESDKTVLDLKNQLQELSQQLQNKESELRTATREKIAALEQLSQEQSKGLRDEDELDTLRQNYLQTKLQLAQAAEEKVKANVQAAAYQQQASEHSCNLADSGLGQQADLEHMVANLRKRLGNVERLAMGIRKLKQELRTVSANVWSSHSTGSKQVDISKLEKETKMLRDDVGLDDHLEVDKGCVHACSEDKSIAIEALGLVDFGLEALMQFNSQRILSKMMQF